MQIFGDRSQLCFEVSDTLENGLLTIDIWCANKLITYFDNMAYLPSFTQSLRRELESLLGSSLSNAPCVNYGPTTDDVSARITKNGNMVDIEFELDDTEKSHVTIEAEILTGIFREVILKLESVALA
ncbi:hypothetical protein [Rheinheimera pacifica]|uniref:hypothetical protein n=1 Tax=Rheinheimera pacifica TaxID=173990 RepID=UPI002EDB8634